MDPNTGLDIKQSNSRGSCWCIFVPVWMCTTVNLICLRIKTLGLYTHPWVKHVGAALTLNQVTADSHDTFALHLLLGLSEENVTSLITLTWYLFKLNPQWSW